MNICLLNRLFQQYTGGIETYTYRMASEYAKRGHRVHIITVKGEHKAAFGWLSDRVTVHEFDFQVPQFKGFWFADKYLPLNEYAYHQQVGKFFNSIHAREQFEVVEIPEYDGFYPSPRRNYPVVVRLHGFHGMTEKFVKEYYQKRPGQFFYKQMVRGLCDSAEYVASVSQNFADMTKDVVGINGKNLTINYLGVDKSRFKLGDETKRDLKTVLFVGRLEKSKGIETIIEAIPKVCRAIPDVKFLMVGRDTLHKENGQSYTDLLKKSCPSRNIEVTGVLPQEEVIRHYQKATAAVFPSLFEPGGTVAIEAMACGCPTITTEIGGFKEYYQNRENGMVIQPEDPSALAESIIEVLQDSSLRKTIHDNALKLVEEKLNLKLIVDKSLKIYQNAIEKKRSGSPAVEVF